ncbi:MAG TPA: nuclear transport factor 2 family protein [Ktedonobacterales bacterium]
MSERYAQLERTIRDHVAAFNAQDLQSLLAGLAEDAVWQTGQDTFYGRDELATLFSEAFRTIAPELAIRSMLVDQDRVACELLEILTIDDAMREDFIAGFYSVDANGVITSAKIYRQGSADI